MTKLCECGCGQPAPIAPRSNRARGLVKGQPQRFIHGHNRPDRQRTSDTFAKIGHSHLGKTNSIETREKIASALRGRPSHRLGHSPSAETREKIAAKLRGRSLSAETWAKLSERMKGRSLPVAAMAALGDPAVQEKRLLNLRKALSDKPKKQRPLTSTYGSDEWKAKIGAANAGKKRSLEDRARMSAAGRLRASDPVVRASNANKVVQFWASLSQAERDRFLAARGQGVREWWANATTEDRERRTKTSEPGRRKGTAAYQQKMQALSLEERRAVMRTAYQAAQVANPSSIEETVAHLLDALGVRYRRQAFIGRFLVDFYVKSKRLVIECDGSYWHNLPGRPEADAQRDSWLKSRGFSVLRLPEADIKAGRVADRLKEIA